MQPVQMVPEFAFVVVAGSNKTVGPELTLDAVVLVVVIAIVFGAD